MKLTLSEKAFLTFLQYSSHTQTKVLIKSLETKQLKCVLEIVYNILKGVIDISKSDRRRLQKNKSNIRRIFVEGLNVIQRKSRLQKISEILPFLIRRYFQYESGTDITTKGEIQQTDQS